MVFAVLTASAQAQTEQETVRFLFTELDINGVGLWESLGMGYLVVSEANCHVTVGIQVLKDGFTYNTNRNLLGKMRWIAIDFNKLFVKSTTITKDSVGHVRIVVPGEDAIEITDEVMATVFPEGKPKRYRENDLILEYSPQNGKPARAINAFSYFVQNFCRGKSSAF